MSIPSLLIALLGIVQLAAAYMYLQVSTSAVHETVVAVLFGSGSIVLALAVLMYELQKQRRL